MTDRRLWWRMRLRAFWWGLTHPLHGDAEGRAHAKKLADEYFDALKKEER